MGDMTMEKKTINYTAKKAAMVLLQLMFANYDVNPAYLTKNEMQDRLQRQGYTWRITDKRRDAIAVQVGRITQSLQDRIGRYVEGMR